MPGQDQCHYVGLLHTLVTVLTHTPVGGDPPSALGGFTVLTAQSKTLHQSLLKGRYLRMVKEQSQPTRNRVQTIIKINHNLTGAGCQRPRPAPTKTRRQTTDMKTKRRENAGRHTTTRKKAPQVTDTRPHFPLG